MLCFSVRHNSDGIRRPVCREMKAGLCIECSRPTKRVHPILGVPLHSACQRDQQKYTYITKSRAMGEFRLSRSDLSALASYEVDNPHYKKAAPMQLYLKAQVCKVAEVKWKSSEPYIVSLTEFSERALQWFDEDPERLKELAPSRFQDLIADRLERMGLEVQLVGNVFRKDGGVDIVAYPKPVLCSFPFLIGVQVKHHRTGAKTRSPEVREFHGALSSRSSPFHVGMIVTNTAFTADAAWFAAHNSMLLRLRDLADLRRWLRNDFVNDSAWREVPDEIELAPGIRITIPKPKIIV